MPWVCLNPKCPSGPRQFHTAQAVGRHQAGKNHTACQAWKYKEVGISGGRPEVPGGGLKSHGGTSYLQRLLEMQRAQERHGLPSHPDPEWQEDMPDDMPLPEDVPPLPDAPEGGCPPDSSHNPSTAWPTELLCLSGSRHVFQQRGGRGTGPGPDRSATGNRAGEHRVAVQRLNAEQEERLQALMADLPRPVHAPATDEDAHLTDIGWRHDKGLKEAAAALNLAGNPSRQAIFSLVTDSKVRPDVSERILRILADPDFEPERVGWPNLAALRKDVDQAMPDFVGTHDVPVIIPGNKGQPVHLRYLDKAPVILSYHNLWETGVDMFGEAEYAASTSLHPQVDLNDSTGVREYSSFAGGLLFQEMYRTAPSGHTVLALMLASDEANFLSRMTAYPVYCESPICASLSLRAALTVLTRFSTLPECLTGGSHPLGSLSHLFVTSRHPHESYGGGALQSPCLASAGLPACVVSHPARHGLARVPGHRPQADQETRVPRGV